LNGWKARIQTYTQAPLWTRICRGAIRKD
jgi:hypothetical protein